MAALFGGVQGEFSTFQHRGFGGGGLPFFGGITTADDVVFCHMATISQTNINDVTEFGFGYHFAHKDILFTQ